MIFGSITGEIQNSIKLSLKFVDKITSEETYKVYNLKVDDMATISVLEDGYIKTVYGRVKTIKSLPSSNIFIELDCSKDYDSKEEVISLSSIRGINDTILANNVNVFNNIFNIVTDINEVYIEIPQYNKNTDILKVYINGEPATEGVDYNISQDSTKIIKDTAWTGTVSPITFTFIVIK